MGRTTSKTSTTSVTLTDLTKALALLGIEVETPASVEAPVETAAKKAPAKKGRKTKAQKEREAKSEAFVGWLRETAEQRAQRKASNKAQAEWMRSKGLLASGPAWDAVSAGERKLTVLRPLDKAHRADVAAKKAAKA